jgi:hypothetical protein
MKSEEYKGSVHALAAVLLRMARYTVTTWTMLRLLWSCCCCCGGWCCVCWPCQVHRMAVLDHAMNENICVEGVQAAGCWLRLVWDSC